MPKTIRREMCQECNHENVSFFLNKQGIETSRCMTPDCNYNNKLIRTNPYLQDPKLRDDLIKRSVRTSSAVEGIKEDVTILKGEYQELRGISKEICELYDYQVGQQYGNDIHIENYYTPDGKLTDQKVRLLATKAFHWVNSKSPNTYMPGLYQARDYTRPLVITEGLIDAMSYAELGHQACSLTHGASNASNNITHDLEELNKYNEIWVSMDMDDPGQSAQKAIIQLLSHKLLYVITFSEGKDANDALLMNVLSSAIGNRKEIIPEGILFGDQIDYHALGLPKLRAEAVALNTKLLNRVY